MKKVYTLFTFFAVLVIQNCLGQTVNFPEKESLLNLTDVTMRKEIFSFSIKGSSAADLDSLSKIKLETIPLDRCSDTYVYFEKGNLYSSELLVNIESEKENMVTEIWLLYGRYGNCHLPDSAFTGIYDPKFCVSHTKKGKPLKSSCKVFRSEDKRRVYIYMLNGEEENRYEVIWILQDKKYYARVIDSL